MNEHVIVKLVGGHRPGFYVTRRPEPIDLPNRFDADADLLVMVDGPFSSYEGAVVYLNEALARRHDLERAVH